MDPRGITYRFLCLNVTVACTPWLSLVPLSGSWCMWMWMGPRTRLGSQRALLPPLVSWLSDPGKSWHWRGGPRSNQQDIHSMYNHKGKKQNEYDLFELKLDEISQIAQQKPWICLKKKELLHTNLILANRYFIQTDLHNLWLSTNVRSKIFTIVPLGSATIISTGKLYFSKCNRAFSLNAWFCSSAWLQGGEKKKTMHWEQGHEKWWTLHQIKAHISTVTCKPSSSLTRDQLLTKLSLSRARTGELSRTVSRRVRPEPTEGRWILVLHMECWEIAL